MNQTYRAGKEPHLPPKPQASSCDEAVDKYLSGRGARKTTRGPHVVDAIGAPYSTNPEDWPKDEKGTRIPQVCWGGLSLPVDVANLHFLVAGVPGTGKTLTICSLLRSVFDRRLRGFLGGHDRAVIYDAKLELHPTILSFGSAEKDVVILNPFDRRSQWWDLAKDYTTSADACQLARTIIRVPENHSQPFFPKSAAAILAAVISVRMRRHPGEWDLTTILKDCLTKETVERAFKEDPTNPLVLLAGNCLLEPETSNNVLAELASHAVDFLPIAACWRRSKDAGKEGVSIKDFLASSEKIILLGANQTHRIALTAINQLFLRRLAEETLDHVADGQWDAQNRTWLILDEVRELGKVDGLSDFINKGRSRGVCTVLGFQDYPGIKNAFGELVAHEITATCQHKLFLKLGGESAEWASKVIGKSEVRETIFSRNSNTALQLAFAKSTGTTSSNNGSGGSEGSSQTASMTHSLGIQANTTVRETDAVLPSELAYLPSFKRAGGLIGFVCQDSSRTELARVSKVFVDAGLFFSKAPAESGSCSNPVGFDPRPREDLEFS